MTENVTDTGSADHCANCGVSGAQLKKKLGRVASNTTATNSTSTLDCHAKCSNIKIIL